MNYKLCLSVILGIVWLSSCNRCETHKVVLDKFENGQNRYVAELDCKEDTIWTFYYYESGSVESVIPYRNGLINGIRRNYYENGYLQNEAIMVNDTDIAISMLYVDPQEDSTIKFYRRINYRELVSAGYCRLRNGRIAEDKSFYWSQKELKLCTLSACRF